MCKGQNFGYCRIGYLFVNVLDVRAQIFDLGQIKSAKWVADRGAKVSMWIEPHLFAFFKCYSLNFEFIQN